MHHAVCVCLERTHSQLKSLDVQSRLVETLSHTDRSHTPPVKECQLTDCLCYKAAIISSHIQVAMNLCRVTFLLLCARQQHVY